MDIRVYLSNGEILDYSQTDAAVEQETLADIQAGRLFVSTSLILGSGESCSIVQLAAVCRIDFITRTPVAAHRAFDASLTLIEDLEEFRRKAEDATKYHEAGVSPGENYAGYLSFELAGRHRLHVAFRTFIRDQLEFFTNLRRTFDNPTMWIEHPLGGVIWLNVHNILSISAAPGFSQYPKGTLLAKPA